MTKYFKFMTEEQLRELKRGNKLPGRGKDTWAFEHTEQADDVIGRIRGGERLETFVDSDFLNRTRGSDFKFVAIFNLPESVRRTGPFRRGKLNEYRVELAGVKGYSAVRI